MANDVDAKSYIFSYKLCSGYNVIQIPSNIVIPNLKQITVKKLSYKFNTINQYTALLSIQGFDLHTLSDGIVTQNYTLSFFNPSGIINSEINYINYAAKPDIQLTYGSSQSQFTIVFNTDQSDNVGSLGSMSVGGSSYVTTSNPLFLEIEFV